MIEDGEIVRRCLAGQMGMMDLLIDRYKTDLYSLCVKLTRDRPDADDLFQDTWARVMRNLESYDPQHKFKSWLFAICANRISIGANLSTVFPLESTNGVQLVLGS